MSDGSQKTALLVKPNAVFVDARTDSAWKGSDRRIQGAVRVDQFDLESQAGNYAKDTKFIVY
jgi:rhodanese-related sulfurtransferase